MRRPCQSPVNRSRFHTSSTCSWKEGFASLDASAEEIVDHAKRANAKVKGPVPLPTRIERYTVLRSPHVDKKSREQFEMRTHKRIIEISEATAKTMDALTKINMPAGVNIRIKI